MRSLTAARAGRVGTGRSALRLAILRRHLEVVVGTFVDGPVGARTIPLAFAGVGSVVVCHVPRLPVPGRGTHVFGAQTGGKPLDMRIGAVTPLLLMLATASLLMVLVGAATGSGPLIVASLLLLAVMLGATVADLTGTRRTLRRHGGSTRRMDADARESFPTTALEDDVPLGGTRDVHESLTEHDVTRDEPAYRELRGRRRR